MANIWCLAFSDLFFDSPEEKIKLGWGFVITLAVLITVNLFLFIKRTVYVLIVERLSKRRAKKQALKADEARQKALEKKSLNPLPIESAADNENPPA